MLGVVTQVSKVAQKARRRAYMSCWHIILCPLLHLQIFSFILRVVFSSHLWFPLLLFSHQVVSNSFVTPWTVACQAPLSMEISQVRILREAAVSFSRGSSRPRDQTHISCLAGGFFTTEPPGKPMGDIQTYLLTQR